MFICLREPLVALAVGEVRALACRACTWMWTKSGGCFAPSCWSGSANFVTMYHKNIQKMQAIR